MIYSGYMPVNQDRAENEQRLWGCGGCGARWPLGQLRERGCPSCRPDEWAESAENEPDDDGAEHCARCARHPVKPLAIGRHKPTAENEPEETWPDEPGDEQCADIFEQVEQAPLVKPTGPCVELDNNGVTWRV